MCIGITCLSLCLPVPVGRPAGEPPRVAPPHAPAEAEDLALSDQGLAPWPPAAERRVSNEHDTGKRDAEVGI